ncbi:hypothetical protein PTKIN_Ptkin16aG0489500 [Pterospermum kingtungense]
MLPIGKCDKIWRLLFFTTVWSTWLFRNEVVFNGSKANFEKLIDDVRLKVAVWGKLKWPNLKDGTIDIARNLNVIKIPGGVKSVRSVGIGGVLRDSDANVILCFSKAAGNIDSNLAELIAVKEAF